MMALRLTTLALLVGCSQDREALPDWSEGYESTSDTGTDITPSVGAYLQLSTSSDVGYDTITHPDGDWTSACAIETDGSLTDYQQQTCYIEVKELDLYASSFQYTIAASGCEYVSWEHYMYEAWELGSGPAEVSYSIDEKGNITDEVNSLDGVPYCEYNYYYWDASSPNCCTGSYTLTINDEQSGKSSVFNNLSWGDRPWECYSGAAFIDPEAIFNDSGWPMVHIVRTNMEYYSKPFAFEPLSEKFFTNLNLANHYDPEDHAEGAPPGHTGIYSQPTYVLQCLDHAREELARIDFIVREWNTEDEFALAETGDPDEEGAEPTSNSPLNDLLDWSDVGDNFVRLSQ